MSCKHHICENTVIKSTLHVTRDTSCKCTKANPNLDPKKTNNQIFNSSNFPTFFRESSVFTPFSSVVRGACGANFSFLAHPKLIILARANAPRAGRPAVNKGRSLKHTSSPPGIDGIMAAQKWRVIPCWRHGEKQSLSLIPIFIVSYDKSVLCFLHIRFGRWTVYSCSAVLFQCTGWNTSFQ